MMKSINDLTRLRTDIKEQIQKAVADCIDSGRYLAGGNVAAFEREFAAYIGSDHCVSLANGTQAIEIALKSVGIKEHDEVITVANAGYYCTCAIMACKASPVYADISVDDYTMDPDSLEKRITSKTKAVILTHLYGKIGNVSTIALICKKNNLWLIEDCAQAHGAIKQGTMAGAFGDCACFSFYPTKNLGAMGDGGAMITSNPAFAEKARQLRQYGWKEKYFVEAPCGTNSRLDELQAAVLRVKLRYLDEWNESRRAIALRYGKGISNKGVVIPTWKITEAYVAHLYVVRTHARALLAKHLLARGIPTEIHYPVPDYRQKPLAMSYAGLKLPVTEMACARVLTLPCFPEMTPEEADSVIEAINNWSAP